MSKRKNIMKIGLALLIAMAFILPGASVMGSPGDEASERNAIAAPDMIKLGDGPVSQEDPACGVYTFGVEGLPNGALVAPGTYNLDVGIWFDPACMELYGPPIVKAFVEVYQDQCGADFIMYETSFEDNFDIYNNWMEVDHDCGVDKEGNPGFFDTWTWTDARASCGDHSMKNTMYDVYKGNQDDYLECTKSFYITDQQGIKVEFDIWVEGDYNEYYATSFYNPCTGYTTSESLYTPFDKFDFEVGDDGGNWVNPDWWYNGLAIIDNPATPCPEDETDYMTWCSSQGWIIEGSYIFPDTSMPIYSTSPYENYIPKVVNKGNGWWTVTWYCDTYRLAYFGLNTDDIQFRFSWHSDPEQQFEGAYVDCFKVYSREVTTVKIHQSHTQGPVTLDPDNIPTNVYYDEATGMWYIRLPLAADLAFIEQCGQKETTYHILTWLEVLNDPCTYWTPYDWPDYHDAEVHVGTWHCVDVSNLLITTSTSGDEDVIFPGDGVIQTGEDAHISADIHATGITPQTDVKVEAKAEKVYWEELYYTDFDNAMGWTFGEFAGLPQGSLWHVTDVTAAPGGNGKSLACNLNDGYYINNMYYDYALGSATFDVRNLKALTMDYAWRMIFADTGDYYRIILQDAATNYILSSYPDSVIPPYFYGTMPRTGYYPDWISEQEPRCRQASIDLLGLYGYWHDIRFMFRNTDGTDAYELGIGFAVFSGASGFVSSSATAAGIYESGLWIDQVSVKAEKVGDMIWNDVIIIPGPLEPCDIAHVQFEWEDVPASNYKITVSVEEGCANQGNYEVFAQIQSVQTVEVATEGEMEYFDYTATTAGAWGISTSDYDNYLATNPDSTKYPADMNAIAQLCPDNAGNCGVDSGEPCCIDISHLTLAPGVLMMDMDMWWDIEGSPYDYAVMEIAPCGETLATDWEEIFDWGISIPPSSFYYKVKENLDADWVKMSNDVDTSPAYGYTMQEDVDWLSGMLNPGYIPQTGGLDLGQQIMYFFPGETEFQLRIRFVSDSGVNMRGMKFDDLTITGMIKDTEFPYAVSDFVDPMDDMSNWCAGATAVGNYWYWDPVADAWCVTWPSGVDVDNAVVWTTEIEDVYQAYFTFCTWYQFGSCSYGDVQIREIGGDWFTLYHFTGTSAGYPTCVPQNAHPDISRFAGKTIQIRFVIGGTCGGTWCIDDLTITGKKDTTFPISTATMSGTMKDSGWYTTAVKIKITATDTGSGVKEIHYILDGVEHVVPGATAEVTVSGNGEHTFEYWAVDNIGNVEPHHVLPAFKIDSGAKPTVSITAPTPGIYFMGKKLLSSSNTIIIGAFTVEATASDADSGIYRVSFYLDGNFVADDTTAPFSAYICSKHMGDATIKVVAEDFAQNTAEAEMSLKYFKFF